ncbi:MAG: thermopsin family protease [Thermoplasmata archaeon]
MVGWSSRPGLAIAVVVFVVLGSLGLVTGIAAATGVGSAAAHPTSPAGASPATASTGTPPRSATGIAKALAIEDALRAKGISPATVHLPNFAGAVTDTAQPIQPSYTQAPAPMGVADIGLENQSGVLVPYELNTTSVAGTVNITNLQSLYLDGDGPDTYGIQLNSVVAGVTIFGNSSYEFWSQNYIDYTVSTQQLVFGDEVWNFSNLSGNFPANSVYGYSPNGTNSSFPYLYQGYGPAITIAYPFTLTLYLNTSTIADRPALYFNYTVSNDTFRQSSSFDYLIFNSSVGTPTQAAPTPYYQADGYNYDPIGLINDMEIDILGNDDGDTTAFFAADATISLQFWNATAGEMQEVPSAYSAGQETGETCVGLLVTSSGGTNPIGEVQSGPGLVGGLWNYSGEAGATAVTVTVHPAGPYSFLFVNVGSTENVSAAQWVPTSTTGTTTFYLPTGGTYFLDFMLNSHAPESLVVPTTGPVAPRTVTLPAEYSLGVYTPIFALTNGELGAISASGGGVAGNPYIIHRAQYGSLAPQFAQWDDYLFPVFPGLLIADTSAWADVTPSSFEINLPSWNFAYASVAALGLPLTNDLQLQFYDASNISLVDAAGISGWMSAFLYQFPESSVMIWDCTNMLVASNSFYDQGNALLLYGGSNNTVWGNSFLSTPAAAMNPTSIDDNGPWVTGVNETESGDLVYNNFFEVGIPAITPAYDPFPCDQYGYCSFLAYNDTWNVSVQPVTNYSILNGWNLTGSIIGTSYQGGNFWSNYGTQADPFGVLPYNDSGAITNGGDYVPLVASTLFPVTFTESGLPSGSQWWVNLTNGLSFSSASTAVTFSVANGTYDYTVAAPAGYQSWENGSGNFTMDAASVSVLVSFATLVPVTFWESGLVPGWTWSVSVTEPANESSVGGTSSASTIVLDLPGGLPSTPYSGQASAFEFPTVNWSTNVSLAASTVPILFAPVNGTLVMQVAPAGATLTVNGNAVGLPANGTATLPLAPGVYAVEVTEGGYVPYFNNVSVASAQSTSVVVSLTSIPTAGVSSTAWVAIGLLAALAVVLGLVALVYRSRGRRPPPKPLEPAAAVVTSPGVSGSEASPPQVWSEK